LKAVDFLSAVCDLSFVTRLKPQHSAIILGKEIDSLLSQTQRSEDSKKFHSSADSLQSKANTKEIESLSPYLIKLLSCIGSPLRSENSIIQSSTAYPYTHSQVKISLLDDSLHDHSHRNHTIVETSPIKGLADDLHHHNQQFPINTTIPDVTAKDFRDLMDAENGSNFFGVECINDELNLQYKSGS